MTPCDTCFNKIMERTHCGMQGNWIDDSYYKINPSQHKEINKSCFDRYWYCFITMNRFVFDLVAFTSLSNITFRHQHCRSGRLNKSVVNHLPMRCTRTIYCYLEVYYANIKRKEN